jgi:Protein of unknown function (DUF3455)
MTTAMRGALLGALWLACAGGDARAGDGAPLPAVPSAIAVPAGTKMARRLHGAGAQVYTCAAVPDQPGKFAWTLKRPDAALSDASGAVSGTHGAGPSWTAKDGSQVIGKKVAEAAAPAADAIPWLLIRAASTAGHGVFTKVTYIQRLNTKGGKAPQAGCNAAAAGTETRVDYSADYVFFE